MKKEMLPGEYTQLKYKTYRCVAVTDLSQQKRCLLCALREFGICHLVMCQPDERQDGKAVIFIPVGKAKKFNNPKIN